MTLGPKKVQGLSPPGTFTPSEFIFLPRSHHSTAFKLLSSSDPPLSFFFFSKMKIAVILCVLGLLLASAMAAPVRNRAEERRATLLSRRALLEQEAGAAAAAAIAPAAEAAVSSVNAPENQDVQRRSFNDNKAKPRFLFACTFTSFSLCLSRYVAFFRFN